MRVPTPDTLEYQKRVIIERNETRELKKLRIFAGIFFGSLLGLCILGAFYMTP
jgi:hypothetical protein